MSAPLRILLTTAAATAAASLATGTAVASTSPPASASAQQSVARVLATRAAAPAAKTASAKQVAALSAAIRDRVARGWSRSIVAGLLLPDGSTRVVTAGRPGGTATLDADSLFEAGSITKTFTASLLADAVGRGEVRLDQPVAELLPPGTAVPATGSRPITLQDLATQTSGLPSLPPGLLATADPRNPYAAYSRTNLLGELGSVPLAASVGTAYGYSNLGFGLLGDALAIRLGTTYEDALKRRVTGPLGLGSTVVIPSAAQRRRLVDGHDGDGRTVPHWTFQALAGAGALRTSAGDLLRYAKANLAAPAGPGSLGPALQEAQAEHWAGDGQRQGLAWVRTPAAGRTIVWHNGGTGGFSTFLGLDPERRTAVVVLSDTATRFGVDDLGFHALEPSVPLADLPTELAVPPALLARVAGRYRTGDGGEASDVTIERRRGGLVAAFAGREFRLYPSSPKRFFARTTELDITFETDGNGRATGFDAVATGARVSGTRSA